MDVDWTLINKAKNLADDQIDQPILKLPIIRDYREPLAGFLRPNMKLLDIGADDRSLKTYLDASLKFSVAYKSIDIDRSHKHDFYGLDEIQESFDAIDCFEVVEHMTSGDRPRSFSACPSSADFKGKDACLDAECVPSDVFLV
jgi:2-polyprenyl-3-methyl-5-hydroxy-6-metoxy-1,4-benzoquinol methylase